MHRRFWFRLVLLTSAVLLLFPSMSVAQSPVAQSGTTLPTTAAYAPSDSVAFLNINIDGSSSQWKQAGVLGDRLGRTITPDALVNSLLQSLGIGPLPDQATGLLNGDVGIAISNPDLLVSVTQLFGGMSDEVSSLIGSPTGAGASSLNGFEVIALVDSPEVVAGALKQAVTNSAGTKFTSTTYKKVAIDSIAPDPESNRPGIAIAVVDSAVVIATNPGDVKAVIDTRGGGKSLADSKTAARVFAPLPSDRLVSGILNGPALSTYTPPASQTNVTLAEALRGINFVSGFALTAQSDGFKIDARSASPDGSPVFGANDNFDPTLIERMPGDTQVLIDGYNLGGTGVLDLAALIIGNTLFGALSAMTAPADSGAAATPTAIPNLSDAADTLYQTLAFLLGFNIKTDLFQKLDGEFALGIWGVDGRDASQANAAFVSNTSDPTSVGNAIGSLVGLLGFGSAGTPVAGSVTVGGASLNSFNSSLFGIPAPIVVGVAGQSLVIGAGADGGSVAVGGSSNSLSASSDFEAATSSLPASRNSLIYLDLQSLASGQGVQSFALAGFQDGTMAGAQGLLAIPGN